MENFKYILDKALEEGLIEFGGADEIRAAVEAVARSEGLSPEEAEQAAEWAVENFIFSTKHLQKEVSFHGGVEVHIYPGVFEVRFHSWDANGDITVGISKWDMEHGEMFHDGPLYLIHREDSEEVLKRLAKIAAILAYHVFFLDEDKEEER